ncbi:MAG: hypothetical protein LUH22_17945 [Bacteroides sp.]|nr:hypothetical protein [Bacteroides sp.]
MKLFDRVLWFSKRGKFDIEGLTGYLQPRREVSEHPRYKSGVFRSEKCGRDIQYESALEMEFIVRNLESNPKVLFYWEQPVTVKYRTGKIRRSTTPDFGAILTTREFVIIEVKSLCDMLNHRVQAKCEGLMEYCSDRGFGFLLTDGRRTPGDLAKCRMNRRFERDLLAALKNGHVRLAEDAHYYSVPCKYIGKKVKLFYTSTLVEVYYRYEKIAEHERSYSRFRYITDQEHLASHHRAYSEWSAEKFMSEATTIHPDLGTYISKVIENKAHPEQAYKSVQGILSFARRVGEKRLINACRWADSYGLYNYPAVESILNNRQDEIPLENEQEIDKATPTHKNIRGKEYYR